MRVRNRTPSCLYTIHLRTLSPAIAASKARHPFGPRNSLSVTGAFTSAPLFTKNSIISTCPSMLA